MLLVDVQWMANRANQSNGPGKCSRQCSNHPLLPAKAGLQCCQQQTGRGHNLTFPRVPTHAALTVVSHARLPHHLCAVPGPCVASRNDPVAIMRVEYCTTCFQNTSRTTVTRRLKIRREIRKKSNFSKQNLI